MRDPRLPPRRLHALLPGARDAERGQVMPVIVIFMGLLGLVAVLFINAVSYRGNAEVVIDGALRAGGLAALSETDPAGGYARWDIDPAAATRAARGYALAVLASSPSLFGPALEAQAADTAGTDGGSQPGIDIEILVPATAAGQASISYLDCDPDLPCAPDAAQVETPGAYPEAVVSQLTGQAYPTTTIVLRATLEVRQLTGTGRLTRTIVIRGGTDDAS